MQHGGWRLQLRDADAGRQKEQAEAAASGAACAPSPPLGGTCGLRERPLHNPYFIRKHEERKPRGRTDAKAHVCGRGPVSAALIQAGGSKRNTESDPGPGFYLAPTLLGTCIGRRSSPPALQKQTCWGTFRGLGPLWLLGYDMQLRERAMG